MHVLVLSDNYPPERNAAASRVHERARFWVRWGHRVTVITAAPNFPEGRVFDGYRNALLAEEWMHGVRVLRVKTFIAPNTGTLKRILDFTSYGLAASIAGAMIADADVVVASSPQFFAGVAGAVAAGALKKPFVLEVADLWPASIVAVGALNPGPLIDTLERLELWLYAQAKNIVLLTPQFREDLTERGVRADKLHVIPNGADLDTFGPQAPDAALASRWGLQDCFVLGYIGTLGMAHGLENALAAAELLTDRPRFRLLLVGPGARREALLAEAERRGLSNVVFVPAQPRAAIPAFWSLCDLALVHLRNDPTFAGVYPSKIFEAMAVGKPVVFAGPDGIGSALVRDEEVGVTVGPDDPEALAEAVRDLMDDPARRRDFGKSALSAAPRHSRETQARDVLAVLRASV